MRYFDLDPASEADQRAYWELKNPDIVYGDPANFSVGLSNFVVENNYRELLPDMIDGNRSRSNNALTTPRCISEWLHWARPIHEHFVFDLERITKVPIVLISTIGMLFGILIGILMGLPRIRNSA